MNRARDDVSIVAQEMSGVTEPIDAMHFSTCQNDGSGPIPPFTSIDLSLEPEATVDEARVAAEAALIDLGYETAPGTLNALFIARKRLDDRWGGDVRLYESPSTERDLTLVAYLTPTITC